MRHLLMLAAEGGEGGMWAAIKDNPTFLVLNMVVSAVVITIIVERAAFQLGRYRVNSKEFFAQIKKLVAAGNIDRAIKLCDASDYPILQLVKAGLTHANKGADEIDAALSEKLSELKPQVGEAHRRPVVAREHRDAGRPHRHRVGPHHARSRRSRRRASRQADKQRMLSNGIAEAMYNTAFGLEHRRGVHDRPRVPPHPRRRPSSTTSSRTTERVFNLLTISNKPGY